MHLMTADLRKKQKSSKSCHRQRASRKKGGGCFWNGCTLVRTQHGSGTQTITGKVHFLRDPDGGASLQGVAGFLLQTDVGQGAAPCERRTGETAEHHQDIRYKENPNHGHTAGVRTGHWKTTVSYSTLTFLAHASVFRGRHSVIKTFYPWGHPVLSAS